MSATRAELEYLNDRFDGAQRLEPPGIAEKRARGRWKDSVETWIGEHPHVCVGAAIVLGVTIGWLVKRR